MLTMIAHRQRIFLTERKHLWASRIPMLFLFFFFLSSYSLHAQIAKVDELAEKLVKSLRKIDEDGFNELITHDSELVHNLTVKLGIDYTYSMQRDFVRILKEGQEKGISWSDIRFLNVTYSIKTSGPFQIAQPVRIIFQHRLFRYEIQMNCTQFYDSWAFVPIARKASLINMVKVSR